MNGVVSRFSAYFQSNDDVTRTSRALIAFGVGATTSVFLYSALAAYSAADKDVLYPIRVLGVFGALFTLGFAAFGAGGGLGFLFGIPKAVNVPAKPASLDDADEDSDAEPAFRSNTNLEEVSDWVTKIIIGVSLVEAKGIARQVGSLIKSTSENFTDAPYAEVICGSVLVGYFTLGFFFVYLLTRLFLTSAFNEAENKERRLKRQVSQLEKTIFGVYDFSPQESEVMRELMGTEKGQLTLAKGFRQHQPRHAALRSLRERGLVDKEGGGSWEPGSVACLTEHAKNQRKEIEKQIAE